MIRNKLSTIITAYNSQEFISEAIESVLLQSVLSDEIIVVDDGSTDETASIVSLYSKHGVKYIYQRNQGPSAARNCGIRDSLGEYLAFLDADDLWLPNKTEKQLNYLFAHPDVYLISGGVWTWNLITNKRTLDVNLVTHEMVKNNILIDNIIGNPSMVLLRREALDNVGWFNPNLRWGEDWELWIRITEKYKMASLIDPVIIYRSHPANLSNSNRLENFNRTWEISRLSILKSKKKMLQPLLLARSFSNISLQRAMYLIESDQLRREQITYSLISLFVYPFQHGLKKLRILFWALIGRKAERRFKNWVRYSKY